MYLIQSPTVEHNHILNKGRESLNSSINQDELDVERENIRSLQKELNESKDKQIELKDLLATKEKQFQESIRRQGMEVQVLK